MDAEERLPDRIARILADLDILVCMGCSMTSVRRPNEPWPQGHQRCGGAWRLVREPQARAALVKLLSRQLSL